MFLADLPEKQPALLSMIFTGGFALLALLLLLSLLLARRRRRSALDAVAPSDLPPEVRQRLLADVAQWEAEGNFVLWWGGYESYLVEREVARRHAREQYEEYAETKGELEARARMQRNWMAKGVRNAVRKAGSEPDKNIRAHMRATSEKQAAKARITEKRIERLEEVEEPRKEWELRMTIAAAPRAGAVVATLRGAVVRRGDFTLGPVDLQVDWGDRLAITGANGSGKSTLIGALLGRVPLDEGTASLGPSVRIGEIDQARGRFFGGETLLAAFSAEVPDRPSAASFP